MLNITVEGSFTKCSFPAPKGEREVFFQDGGLRDPRHCRKLSKV